MISWTSQTFPVCVSICQTPSIEESLAEIYHWVSGVIWVGVSGVGKRRRFGFIAWIRWAGIIEPGDELEVCETTYFGWQGSWSGLFWQRFNGSSHRTLI